MGASLGNSGSSRASRRSRGQMMTEINVTPFVDVMLVLLVIFMVTAPMLTAGVNVDLPQASAKPLAGQDEPLSISINSSGKVFLQKTEIDGKELRAKLSAIAAEKKDTRIFVRGDKNVDYGKIMQVVGEINAAGLSKVSLVTEPGAIAPTTTARR